ncbi:MAG: hypothetical protein KKB50_05230 [Planctomycetes bacterium]|nr:hypothetical protein [Planctomycetota bacterium]
MRWLRFSIVLTTIVLLSASPTLAQQDTDEGPAYEEGLSTLAPNNKIVWINWGFGVLLIAGCAGLALKNPHRSHLD